MMKTWKIVIYEFASSLSIDVPLRIFKSYKEYVQTMAAKVIRSSALCLESFTLAIASMLEENSRKPSKARKLESRQLSLSTLRCDKKCLSN